MRRRIYIAPDGSGLEDITARPYRYRIDRHDEVRGALYDDGIWLAYLEARKLLQVLESTVIGHLRGEPYDEIELHAAEEAETLMDGSESQPIADRVARMEALAQQLVDHAEALHGDGEAPR